MSQTNDGQTVTGQIIKNPIIIDDPSTQTSSVYVQEKTYVFRKHELYILKSNSGISNWVSLTQGATIGFLINIVAKFIYGQIIGKSSVENWELFAFFISGFATIVLFLIDRYLISNERKGLLSILENHFKD
jgi:hypothetical protein